MKYYEIWWNMIKYDEMCWNMMNFKNWTYCLFLKDSQQPNDVHHVPLTVDRPNSSGQGNHQPLCVHRTIAIRIRDTHNIHVSPYKFGKGRPFPLCVHHPLPKCTALFSGPFRFVDWAWVCRKSVTDLLATIAGLTTTRLEYHTERL